MINKSEKLKGPSRSPGAHFVFLTNQRECSLPISCSLLLLASKASVWTALRAIPPPQKQDS